MKPQDIELQASTIEHNLTTIELELERLTRAEPNRDHALILSRTHGYAMTARIGIQAFLKAKAHAGYVNPLTAGTGATTLDEE